MDSFDNITRVEKNAPDKIYLAKSLSFPDKIHSQWYKEDVVGNGIEYIRKDALLKWAKDFIAKTGWYEIEVALNGLFDKLNEL